MNLKIFLLALSLFQSAPLSHAEGSHFYIYLGGGGGGGGNGGGHPGGGGPQGPGGAHNLHQTNQLLAEQKAREEARKQAEREKQEFIAREFEKQMPAMASSWKYHTDQTTRICREWDEQRKIKHTFDECSYLDRISQFQEHYKTQWRETTKLVDHLVQDSRTTLSEPSIQDRLSPEARMTLEDELTRASQLSRDADAMKPSPWLDDYKIELIRDYALDKAIAIKDFTQGMVNGVYKGFYDQAQVIKILAQNPAILFNLSHNLLNAIDDPQIFMDVTKDAYQHYKTTLLYGSAEEMGEMTGELMANILTGMAGAELLPINAKGLLTLAGAPGIEQATPLVAKLIEESPSLSKSTESIQASVKALDAKTNGSIRGWDGPAAKITHVLHSDAANAMPAFSGYVHPYAPSTSVVYFETLRESKFVRVYDGIQSKQQGNWMMRKSAIEGLTPSEIRVKYSLPHEPKWVTDVSVPKGYSMSRGQVNDILYKLKGIDLHTPPGTMQYRLEGKKYLPESSFKNPRPIGDL